MGTAAADNIAIAIATSFDDVGTAAARASVTALGTEATKASSDMAKAADSGAKAETSLAAAATKATTETKALGAAADKTKSGLQEMGKQGDTAGVKIPAGAKAGASAIAILTQAAVTGSGSMAGMANAAGNAATALAGLAKSAALATGIGAVVAVLTAGVGAVISYRDETKKLDNQLKDLESTGRQLDDSLANNQLMGRLEQINRAADVEIRQLQETHFHADEKNKIIGEINTNRQRSIALATQEFNIDKARAEAGLDQIAARTSVDRYNAELKLIELQRQEDQRRGLQGGDAAAAAKIAELNRQGDLAIQHASDEVGQLIGQLNGVADARHRAIESETKTELEAVDQLKLTETQRSDLITDINNKRVYGLKLLQQELDLERAQALADLAASSGDPREQFQGRLRQIELERDAEIKAGLDVVTATAIAEEKKRQLIERTTFFASHSWLSLVAEMESSMQTAIDAQASLSKILKHTLLEPIALELHALAQSEFVKSLAHFADFDIVGGLAHAAAGGLAEAAAVKVEGWGSLSGGGSSSAPAGAGAGVPSSAGPSYTPSDQGNHPAAVVNLYTSDPFGRENIMIASYQLNRAGTLNRPVYLPPTTGLQQGRP